LNPNKFITKRIIAGIIDYTVIFSATFIYISQFGELNSEGAYSVNGIKTIPVFLFWLIYICGIETILNSTLGNYIVKLKPIDLKTGRNITFKQSFLRHIVDIIDMQFLGLVAIIIIKNSSENQRLGDLLAKTKVVKI